MASSPVLDELPEGYQVAVENSAIVYDDGEGTVSTIVCNWFGAGNVGLANPDSDSSIQSYANIYDMNWLTKGNVMIAPGVQRVDTVKTADGYEMKSIWCRNDLSDTSILKLSTATGYIYGYVQDLNTGMWQYIILDFETGETVFTMDVSNKYGYNNMAIGMYAGNSGNALYCPTGYLELLRLQDRFVYLPEMPYREIDLDLAARNVLTQEKFTADGGEGSTASWLNTVAVRNVHPNTTVAFRMNNLSGTVSDLKLYAYDADGKLVQVANELWTITDEAGETMSELTDGTLYEVRITVADGGDFDLSETEKKLNFLSYLGNSPFRSGVENAGSILKIYMEEITYETNHCDDPYAFLLCSATACGKTSSEVFEPLNAESKDATEITAQANAEVYQLLDFSDEQESEFASRGFIAAPDSLVIQAENGMTIWSQDAYDFVRKNNDAPTSVNPSLWRNTQYNTRYGLFQVSDDIYQVRGYDISNITFVRSKNGWIIMDCGSSRYTAAEALKFFRSQMGDDRIVAIIISHAHADHYGGIEGLISSENVADPALSLEEQIASGKLLSLYRRDLLIPS